MVTHVGCEISFGFASIVIVEKKIVMSVLAARPISTINI